ncbi:hypothetical protein HH310_28375 [Actinoplanes sp. TBRC 11911]|uniref:hypothetical protein n=1 Tax=Actinoplanes sp. TBRC 11911 TaxID=2729386 RepID=UPI00145F1046|nr:hypothetical protein [Actinoplanes sp. TBRC 11911]NMO55090.1 hypothetical protein [Actinoplanes sp. TBRC 11911]
MGHDDYYEEDEDVDALLAEFEAAPERGKTERPARGQTQWLTIFGMAVGKAPEPTHPNNLNFFAA